MTFVLLITGRIGMLGLCNFSCDFSVGVKVPFGLGILFFVYLRLSYIVLVFFMIFYTCR